MTRALVATFVATVLAAGLTLLYKFRAINGKVLPEAEKTRLKQNWVVVVSLAVGTMMLLVYLFTTQVQVVKRLDKLEAAPTHAKSPVKIWSK
jgi:heme/copper-type cytochrome/quinol oxidase subunit 2